MIDFAKLAAPFSPTSVSWRVGAKAADNKTGLALAYIDARDVMDRLDEVCTPAGWQCRYSHATTKTVCDIGIKVGDEWIWKANGAGDTDVEGEKGALSDAIKRAAVVWGIGRYLYSVPKVWVKIRAQGRSFVIDESDESKLIAVLEKMARGVIEPDSMPPRHQDGDVVNGHAEWVSKQKAFLTTVVNTEDLRTWHDSNKKNIEKLSRDNIPLHGDLKLAYKAARERLNTGARMQ